MKVKHSFHCLENLILSEGGGGEQSDTLFTPGGGWGG